MLPPMSLPDLVWARSGAMDLTGPADGPPCLAPAPLASCAAAALGALRRHAGDAWTGPADGAALLGERAAISGGLRQGPVSVGGSCRLLPARDGWIAVNLARADDRAAVPAWLGTPPEEGPWAAVERALKERSVAAALERGRLLGLPVAAAGPRRGAPPAACRMERFPSRARRSPSTRPLVVDLSVLWAGPLATHLLAAAGARVIKVESEGRPDGARWGPEAFFDLLNAGKQCVALDFGSARDRRRLAALVRAADIVVESARPRALAQLGLDAAAELAARPGRVWVSITGYGRRLPHGERVAFGDDAAAAAGLCAATGRADAPIFCGDAIADPLAGLHAALTALAAWRAGGGRLLDVALRDVVAHAMAFPGEVRVGHVVPGDEGWLVEIDGRREPVAKPRARPPAARAPKLGADTAAVWRELAPC